MAKEHNNKSKDQKESSEEVVKTSTPNAPEQPIVKDEVTYRNLDNYKKEVQLGKKNTTVNSGATFSFDKRYETIFIANKVGMWFKEA